MVNHIEETMVTSLEVREKIIELHQKGVTYGAIAKELNNQITERTIGSIIRQYEKSVLEQQTMAEQTKMAASVVPPVTGEIASMPLSDVATFGGPLSYLINNPTQQEDQEEIDFDDVAFDDILSGDYDYDPRLDGPEGERLLGFTSSSGPTDGGEPGSIAVIQQTTSSGATAPTVVQQPEVTVTSEPPEEEIDDDLREIQETINESQRKYAQKNNLSIKNVMQMIVQDKRERKSHEEFLARRELALKEGQEDLANNREDFVQQQQNAAYEKQYTTKILERVQPLWSLYNCALNLKIGQMSLEVWAKIISEKAQSRNISADAAAISIRTELANYSRIGGVTKALNDAQYQLAVLRKTMAEDQEVVDMVKKFRQVGFSEKDIHDTVKWVRSWNSENGHGEISREDIIAKKSRVSKSKRKKKLITESPIPPDDGNGKATPIPITIPDTSAAATGDISS